MKKYAKGRLTMPTMILKETPEPQRDEKGKWLPGCNSPNPTGNPKGLRIFANRVKQGYLEVFEDLGGKKALKKWILKSLKNKEKFYCTLAKMLLVEEKLL